jgi:mannan endo-1,4-beta-mannosidase
MFSTLHLSIPQKKHFRNIISGCIVCILAACSNIPTDYPSPITDICRCDSGQCQSVSSASRFGFYDERLLSSYTANLSAIITQYGASPAGLLWFVQIDDPFPGSLLRINRASGIKTVLSINMKSLQGNQQRNDTLLQEIIDGLWDSTFSVFADSALSYGDTIYYRFGYEMNGDWFPWGSHPDQFASAWRRAHDIFSSRRASNILWVFSPNALWDTRSFDADILPYYPGDNYVDIIGLDGYNFGDQYDQWHRWQSFEEIFAPSLSACTQFGKPLWITETGCPTNPGRSQWLNNCFAYLDRNPCLEMLIWFNASKTGEPDFRLESDSASLATIQNWLAH